MSFSEAVQWWDEWQLRVLALGSLFLQYFLFVAAGLRKRRTPAWFKFVTWLAFMGSDAVAIYGLATLFNGHNKNQQDASSHRGSATLEVLWAPILLMHLGGQDGMTAYNIEDNELWTRHVLTAISQIVVAIYVFRKSFSGEKKLLQAAILVFVPGILKCLEKPWALKSASINSIAKSSGSWLQRMLQDGDRTNQDITSLEDYVRAASTHVVGHQQQQPHDNDSEDEIPPLIFKDKPYRLFVDLANSYTDRFENLKYMVQEKDDAHRHVRYYLSMTFARLYTKNAVFKGFNIADCSCKSYWGHNLRGVILYLTFAAIPLFHLSNRQAYNSTDVKITYTLLCCTAALEYISTGIIPYFDMGWRVSGRLPWPDQISQYNLIWYLSRNRRHSWLRKLATLLLCKGYLDKLWCMVPCRSSRGITELVHDHVTDGWRNCINDTVTYRKFNESRGQQTLQRERCGTSLEWSLRRPFDESVVLWHLATDFCFHHMRTSTMRESPYYHVGARKRSREMSNYMAYLLFVNTEMLIAGARSKLFRDAYKELKKLAKGHTPPREDELARKIIQKLQVSDGTGLVNDAWLLAQELMGMVNHQGPDGEDRMWRVIQGVWVEMLCFSASRCRGYLHAKSLGKGGECLSYVWLLLSYMGMETLAERLQRTELHAQGDMGGVASSRRTSAAPRGTANGSGDHNA